MKKLLIIMMVTVQAVQVLCRDDFILASDIYNFYTRPIESTTSFTSFPKPHLVGPVGHGIMYDTTYDPVTDKIYWIEKLTNWISQTDPKICPTTIAIGRCDFDGTNSELLIEGINNGTQCIPSVNPAIELDTKSRRLYWSSVDIEGNVLLQTSTIEGTDIQTTVGMTVGHVGYTDISIDEHSGDIYWLAGDDIHRVDIEDGDIEVVVKGPVSQVGISSIAVDLQGNLFWTTSRPATVSRSTLQGTNTMLLFETPDEDSYARDISLYRDSIYFVQRSENQSSTEADIYLMNKDGSTPSVVKPLSFDLTSLHTYFTTTAAPDVLTTADTSTTQTHAEQTAAAPGVLTTTTVGTSTTQMPSQSNQTIYISLAISLSILLAAVIAVAIVFIRIGNCKMNDKKTETKYIEDTPLHRDHTYLTTTPGQRTEKIEDPVHQTYLTIIPGPRTETEDPLHHTYLLPTPGLKIGHDNPVDTDQIDMHGQGQASEDYAQPYDVNITPVLASVTNASEDTVNDGRVGDQEDLNSINPLHVSGDSTAHVYEEITEEPTRYYDFVPDLSENSKTD